MNAKKRQGRGVGGNSISARLLGTGGEEPKECHISSAGVRILRDRQDPRRQS